jgi:leader peptidase (prepilin peptidase)/N-methyltransferase
MGLPTQAAWQNVLAISGFTIAGGWLVVHATKLLAGRTLPLVGAIAMCGLLACWTFYVVFGLTAFVLSLCLGWALLVLAIVDWLEFRLPDVLTLPLTLAGLMAAAILPSTDSLDGTIAVAIRAGLALVRSAPNPSALAVMARTADHAAAAAAAYAVLFAIAWLYRRLRAKEGMGLGDAKLAAAAGAWLGFAPLPSVLFLASMAGIVWVLVAGAARGKDALSQRIPFGVPLSFAIWIVWLYGPFVAA